MKRIYNPVKKKTILIVDDDRVAVDIYRGKFQRQGFKIEIAGDGESAIRALKKKALDLVILDLCLPGMNGVEVLKNIRSEFDRHALPIIVLSNSYLGKLERAALEAGATKCVRKAASTPNQMVDLVREVLAAGCSDAEGTHSDAIASNAADTFEVEPETTLQEKLVATVLNNAPATLAKLRTRHQVFAKTKPEDLRHAALGEMQRQVHSLSSSTGLLGFRKIAQLANALEALLIELLAKPQKITPSVIRTIAQAIDTLSSLFDQATNSQTEILAPPKILVVDDEVISRETISSALGKADLPAVCLDDSLAAQRLLEHEHFDLIFLDVEMPRLTGLELCVKIREMAANRATPVVFVTSHSDFGSRAQSTLSGGNDFIAKPFLLVELAVKALTWLFKERAQPMSAAIAQQSAPAEANSHVSALFADHPALSVHTG